MQSAKHLSILLLLPLFGACVNTNLTHDYMTGGGSAFDRRDDHIRILQHYTNDQVRNAILTQSSVFPYHFFENSAELNDLGYNDLMVLSERFYEGGGTINVRRGGVSEPLYQARLDTIRRILSETGVNVAQVNLVDDVVGGDGVPAVDAQKTIDFYWETQQDRYDRRWEDEGGFAFETE